MTTETSDFLERTPEKIPGYATIGAIRSMLANRISFQFDFKGINFKINSKILLILVNYKLLNNY